MRWVETIADRVRAILSEAVQRVSNGGTMKFDIRSLFYAIRELYLKRWPDQKFYEYNSFTQDFMRSYEKQHGKIPGMLRGPRGKYAVCDDFGWRTEADVKPELYVKQGIGNKIIMVEKLGLYEQMVANDFDKRLDCILICTQGFTSEAGREAMIQVAGWGLPVVVLHDYDVNGVLIKETLTRPTKRLDTEINPDVLVDVGLNYEVVTSLMAERGLTPEPVSLSKEDRAKLNGLLERGEITEEEQGFLLVGRVELNALTPRELLDWLEDRLEALDLWKTVPNQRELDAKLKEIFRSRLADSVLYGVKDTVGYDDVYDLMLKVEERIKEKIAEALKEEELPETIDQEEFKEKMRERMDLYWTRLADSIAAGMVRGLDTRERAEKIAETMQEIADKLSEIEDLLNEITGD